MRAADDTTAVPAISLELMLAGWRESNTGGATVTFWLPGLAELDVFRAMTVRKGGKAGQRFMAALALLGEDELPVEAPGTTPEPKRAVAVAVAAGPPCQSAPVVASFKGGPLSKLAGRWCGSETFQRWARPVYDRSMGGDGSGWGDIGSAAMEPAEFARHAILMLCDIESRRELDHDAGAAARFHDLVRRPFAAYMEAMSDEPA